MYFPLLRGKQFELKALRKFSSSFPNNTHVIPIIEPVNEGLSSLVQGIREMSQNGLRFAMILNPERGDFKHDNVSFKLLEDYPEMLNQLDRWIPAYLVKRDSVKIKQLIDEGPFSSDVMLVVKSAIDLDDASMMKLINDDRVGYIVHDFDHWHNKVVKFEVLKEIRKDLSKPLTRYDTELEYVPTQWICEYCKKIGADGISFASSLDKNGINYVLFNQDDAKCKRVKSRTIEEITIRAKK